MKYLPAFCLWILAISMSGFVVGQDLNRPDSNISDVPFADGAKQRPRARKPTEREVKTRVLMSDLDRELQMVRQYAVLAEPDFVEIRDALKPVIEETAAQHPKYTASRNLPDELDLKLQQLVSQASGNSAAFRLYAEDAKVRRAFQEKVTMQGYVYYIDSFVGLRDDQWEAVRRVGLALHRVGDLDVTRLRHRDSVPKPDLNALATVLTESQQEYLLEFSCIWRKGEDEESLCEAFRRVATMKVEQLDQIVGLTESQRAKVDFVAKRTLVSGIVKRRMQASENLKAFAQNGAAASDGVDMWEVMNSSTARLPHLFADQRWKKFVEASLDPEQQITWREFTRRRLQAAVDIQAYTGAQFLWGFPLSGKQRLSSHRLLVDAVRMRSAALETTFALVPKDNLLTRIKRDEFRSAIGELAWEGVDRRIKGRLAK